MMDPPHALQDPKDVSTLRLQQLKYLRLTNPLPGGQWRRLDAVDQQVTQQFGDERPLQVDVDEP